jgi:hypothetical protein
MQPGKYSGNFKLSANGTQAKPITLRGTKSSIITNPGKDGISLVSNTWWILDG